MKTFWNRGSSTGDPFKRNGLSPTIASKKHPSTPTKSKRSSSPSTSMPTRKQRMQLLKCIIHHADAVQKQYLVPKQSPLPSPKPTSSSTLSMDNMRSMIVRNDTATAEINDKCYQRWHQVLQEGLVPMSVRALNLLDKSPAVKIGGDDAIADDEEEAYFATMEGMDEEIQIMAILARAAALECSENENTAKNDDGMEQVNAMMKCTAMLLFHVVLAASSPGESETNMAESTKSNTSSAETTETVAGYDGRVRHVMKLACVDVLTRAIIETVESFDDNNVSDAKDGEETASVLYEDGSDYPLWNFANIKLFLDQTDLGKDAIFGTTWRQFREEARRKEEEKRQSESETDDDASTSQQEMISKSGGDIELSSLDKVLGEALPPETLESVGSKASSESSTSLEIQSEHVVVTNLEAQSLENNTLGEVNEDAIYESDNLISNQDEEGQGKDDAQGDSAQPGDDVEENVQDNQSKEQGGKSLELVANDEELQDEAVKDQLRARHQLNAKFLATRKFELIERLVAIDIVRFLMAVEREKHERDLAEQNNRAKKAPPLFRRGNNSDVQETNNEDGTADLGDSNQDNDADESSNQEDTNTSSQIFTAARIKSIKRASKIAGAGLALGTVFAITGGLAAPALAAGLGSLAALAGASTASSTALLAVLATFKAGAALFGVGGGGLAAYRMKKRTQGLSQFEIKRENIDQYMYLGASDEAMKKGVETMLPQLHTTVAVSGWLRDNDIADFQLAWGIGPTCKYEKDDSKRRIRQMKRFYSIHNPPLVHLCEEFMQTLQKRLKKDFSWDRIWDQLAKKYGTTPDHVIPMDTLSNSSEVLLSHEEKDMIDGVLNDAKIINLGRRGFGSGDGIDLNEDDEITELLANVSPKRRHRKTATNDSAAWADTMENEDLVSALESDLALDGSYGEEAQQGSQSDEEKTEISVDAQKELERRLMVSVPSDNGDNASEKSPSLQERMAIQREQQVSFLKEKGLLDDETNLKEGAGSPKMASAESSTDAQDPPTNNELAEEEKFDDEQCPVVWDWTRLYGTADIHTVTWESKMLSSLCHIVENMALETATQATRLALQYSVIGAVISAISIPSALVTASKLIDDPYQIVVIRADEAGKELAKCLLQSDERRPVTLVGFSFGARVVYSCLRELAHQQDLWEEARSPKCNDKSDEKTSKSTLSSSFLSKKSKSEPRFEYDREPASLVGDVVFIGLPRAYDKKVLTSCRRVTGGRLVNCYTRNDWLLSLMFVARGGTPCGIKPITDVPGVENYDVTDMVETHTKYADAIPDIMRYVRFSEP